MWFQFHSRSEKEIGMQKVSGSFNWFFPFHFTTLFLKHDMCVETKYCVCVFVVCVCVWSSILWSARLEMSSSQGGRLSAKPGTLAPSPFLPVLRITLLHAKSDHCMVIFTSWLSGQRGIVIACIFPSHHLSVCPSVHRFYCLHDKSSQICRGIIKFAPNMHHRIQMV